MGWGTSNEYQKLCQIEQHLDALVNAFGDYVVEERKQNNDELKVLNDILAALKVQPGGKPAVALKFKLGTPVGQ